MPRSPTILSGTATTSPRHSSSTVNDVVSALSRKITSTVHVEAVPSSRRSSFSMENILHPGKKEKKRDDSKEREARKDKRISMPGSKPSKSKDRNAASPRVNAVKPAKFDIVVESPSLVFYGSANSSTGAIFSGRLRLTVQDPIGSVKLNDFTMTLRAIITTQKPISKECKQCIERIDELQKWNVISEPTLYTKPYDNQFPFSWLFPGNLPATTNTTLGSLSYSLYAVAHTVTGEKIEFVHPIKIQRAIPPGPDKSSIRIFPPTNLTGRVQIPPVIHPIGTFPVKMTINGVVEKRAESQTRWRLRKMMWRVEEQCKIISAPCSKHSHKVSDGKAIQHQDTRTVCGDELKGGWKTDFDTAGGEINLEFDAALANRNNQKITCDMDSPAGLSVKHTLIIELIVAEEYCPNKNTKLITPTGAARVLRMQFNLLVTERAGMGISWDEEMPPMYDDVPPSPPGYGKSNKNEDEFGSTIAQIEEYTGPTIVPHDLQRLNSTTADGLPHYREVVDGDVNLGLPMRERRGSSDEAESSTRRRLAGLRMDDLEAESAAETWRRRRLEQLEEQQENSGAAEDDYAEGSTGHAAGQG